MSQPQSQDLIINPEYASMAPPLSIQDYESLKRSIKENGQYFSIIVNNRNVVLDGHHRLRICRELGIEPINRVKNFASPDHEKLFVYECNLRRHLTPFQKIALRAKLPRILRIGLTKLNKINSPILNVAPKFQNWNIENFKEELLSE